MANSEPVMPQGFRLLHLEEVDSTNSEASRQIANGVEGPLWIWADRQTAGRGRRGREWVSEPGNLFCTLVLPVDKSVAEAAKLTFVASLAAADTVGHFAPPADVKVKWPNDVLLSNEKIVGILLESSGANAFTNGQKVVLSIGIGINLSSHPEMVETAATSLKSRGFEEPHPSKALSLLAEQFCFWLEQWRTGGFEPIRTAWLAKAKGVGQDIAVKLPQETLNGVFLDLDPTGALILKLADGSLKPINAGEVFFNTVGNSNE